MDLQAVMRVQSDSATTTLDTHCHRKQLVTLFELSILFSIAASAIAGGFTGARAGTLWCCLGVVVGGVVGLLTYVVLMGVPGFLLSRTNLEETPKLKASLIQNFLAGIMLYGAIIFPLIAIVISVYVVGFVSGLAG